MKEIEKLSAAEADVTKAIRVLMAEHDIKWADVARIIGIKPASIYSKKDANTWTVRDLVKLSRYFREPIVIGGRYAK